MLYFKDFITIGLEVRAKEKTHYVSINQLALKQLALIDPLTGFGSCFLSLYKVSGARLFLCTP